jgi:putative transposase
VGSNPFDSPISMIKIFNGVTSLRLFERFPELSKQLWRGVHWSPSYYVGTAGHVSKEVIEKYIHEQEWHSSTG